MGRGEQSSSWFRWVAGLCWVGLSLPLVWICHAGLMALPLPGLDGDVGVSLKWAFAAGLVAADSVLVLAWLHKARWYFLAGVACVVALSVAMEAANIESGLRLAESSAAGSAALLETRRAEEGRLMGQIAEAEAEVAKAIATQSLWANDGDKTNDGMLLEAEALLRMKREAFQPLSGRADEQIVNAAESAAKIHPLAEIPFRAWIVSGGLIVVKCLCWALCTVLHAPALARVPEAPGVPVGSPVASPGGARRKRAVPAFKGGAIKGGFVAGMVEKLRR